MRDISFIIDYIEKPFSSVLISCGKTKVLTTISVQEKVPGFVEDGQGWLTAEYSLLPASTDTRVNRERSKIGGRTAEIQRLIGRSLRMAVDLKKIPGYTLTVDADVIQADGGTRTASINGAMLALYIAAERMVKKGMVKELPIRNWIGAISAGIVDNEIIVDLDYKNDFAAAADFNFVFSAQGTIIEVQGTAEEHPVSEQEFVKLFEESRSAVRSIIGKMKKEVAAQ